MISFDTDELVALSVDLGNTGRELTPALTDTFSEAAEDLADTWRSNARETSGTHGKHYPDSIDTERLLSTGIAFEIGPNPYKRQGGMAFESGSVNQPPHPAGAAAADLEVPLLERRIALTLAYLGL